MMSQRRNFLKAMLAAIPLPFLFKSKPYIVPRVDIFHAARVPNDGGISPAAGSPAGGIPMEAVPQALLASKHTQVIK